jgi:hypothetical protein
MFTHNLHPGWKLRKKITYNWVNLWTVDLIWQNVQCTGDNEANCIIDMQSMKTWLRSHMDTPENSTTPM